MWNIWVFLWLTITKLLLSRATGQTILAFYDANDPSRQIQRAAYTLAVEKANATINNIDLVYRISLCGTNESDTVQNFVADRPSLLAGGPSENQEDRLVILGGCRREGVYQTWFPQITCHDRNPSEGILSGNTLNVISLRLSITALYPGIVDIASHMYWKTVCIIHVYGKDTFALSSLLIKEGIAVSLIDAREDNSQCSSQSQVVIAFDMVSACAASEEIPILLPSVEEREELTSCHSINRNIYEITLERLMPKSLRYSGLISSMGIDISNTRVLDEAMCSYDSMLIALTALRDTLTRDELLERVRWLSGNIQYNGEVGSSNSAVDESVGKKLTRITITRQNELGIGMVIGEWTEEMGLNLTENITARNEENFPDSVLDDFSSQLTALGIISSFALLGIVYSIALIVFNCLKGKDRTIKLTSPNINVMTCLGSILTMVSMLLLGIERPITADLTCIGKLQQAGVFAISIGVTIIHASILVKTWRVHRIFKKMHISTKGTKDELLILMIVGLTLIDVAINTIWAKVDRITCIENTAYNQQGGELLCRSQYQAVWSCLLTGYKLLLTMTTLFYAWHVRHIKLPSLKDSQLILMNSLINIAVLLTSLPALASTETINSIRFTTLSLSSITTVFSTLSLLLAPKIFLLRNKDVTKSKSAVRFLFGESLKKQKTKEEPPTGCWANFKSRNSQSGSSMGDSVLSQEIETLKQLVKEKDDTIRDLNDRLFFGADNFRAYINDKTNNTSRKTSVQLTDMLNPSLSGTDNQQYQRTRSWQKRSSQKPQFSPASSIDSGTVDDIFSSRSQARNQPANFYSLDNLKYSTHNHSRENNSMSHTLPPIRESSVNDLTNYNSKQEYVTNQQYSAERSATPTTDSAINMSRSASSSEDESYHCRDSSPSMHEVAERMRHVALQQSENIISPNSGYSSSDDHTLKSTSTVITTATLSPNTETDNNEPISSQHFANQGGGDQSASHKVRNGRHSKASADSSRRPTNSRQSRTPHPQSLVNPNHYSNTGYSHSPVHQLNDSVVGDEVELEIVFPVAKIS